MKLPGRRVSAIVGSAVVLLGLGVLVVAPAVGASPRSAARLHNAGHANSYSVDWSGGVTCQFSGGLFFDPPLQSSASPTDMSMVSGVSGTLYDCTGNTDVDGHILNSGFLEPDDSAKYSPIEVGTQCVASPPASSPVKWKITWETSTVNSLGIAKDSTSYAKPTYLTDGGWTTSVSGETVTETGPAFTSITGSFAGVTGSGVVTVDQSLDTLAALCAGSGVSGETFGETSNGPSQVTV